MPDDQRLPTTDRPPPGQGSTPGGRWRRAVRSLAAYGAVLALTLVLLPLAVPLVRADLRTPFNYGGDALLHLTFTKTLVERGWFWSNPSLGAPGELELYEFPAVDTLPALILKALSVFTRNPALLDNLFYLLTYPLASLAAFAVCRRFGISVGPAALAGVLYAFLPYHQSRNETHLYLSAYFVVPLAVLVAWWVAEGRLLGRIDRPRLLVAVALCVPVALAGVYYAFFSGGLLTAAGLFALGRRRDWRHGVAGAGLAALVAAGLLVCLFPAWRYLHARPGLVPASVRYPFESEVYSLKIAQLMLPVDGHRLRPWRKLKSVYDQTAPLINENSSASLGAVGAAGFLVLVGWLLFRPLTPSATGEPAPGPPVRRLLDVLGGFNAVALLFGTTGGFGSLFALFVSPQVRSLNRVSVFIAFFALAASAVCLDAAWRRWLPPAWRAAGWAGLGVLLLAGVLDQTTPPGVAGDQAVARAYRDDQDFYRQVAAALPPRGAVFELPYMIFPEDAPREKLEGLALLRGYLHTDGLRWSYGAMRGSAADQWQEAAGNLPPEACARRLALAGFDGVVLERAGYADRGAAWEAGLSAVLGPPLAVAPDRLFFGLTDAVRTLRATMTPVEWRRASDEALHRVYARFQTGFAAPTQRERAGRWLHWCAPAGELTLVNPSGEARRTELRMTLFGGQPGPVPLTLVGGGVSAAWMLTPRWQAAVVSLDLPPGECVLRFKYGKPGETPSHPHETAWCLTDFKLDEPGPLPPPGPLTPPTPGAAAVPPGAP